jgi:hypothetical protein
VTRLLVVLLLVSVMPGVLAGQERARLTGRVTDTTEAPVVGVAVTVNGTELRAVTGDSGTFELREVPAGRIVLQLNRLGFSELLVPLELQPGESRNVELVLDATPLELPRVEVQRQASKYRRRVTGIIGRFEAGQGVFVTRSEIDRRKPMFPSDLFKAREWIRVLPGPAGTGRIQLIQKGFLNIPYENCTITYYVDGYLMPIQHMPRGLDAWSPDEIEIIEIYRWPSETPPEFMTNESQCGVIAIWTRR